MNNKTTIEMRIQRRALPKYEPFSESSNNNKIKPQKLNLEPINVKNP